MPKRSTIINLCGAVSLLAAFAVLAPTTPAAAAPKPWTGAWATSPQREIGPTFDDQTLRLLVHPTIGGSSLRIRLANTFGAADVTFDAVRRFPRHRRRLGRAGRRHHRAGHLPRHAPR